MQKKFITNLGFLLFLNLLIKPFWLLGIDRSVQITVGAETYGLYYALFNFSFLFNILLDVGITNFNNRNIAQHRQLIHKHLSGIITLRVGLALVYLLVSLIAALLIGYPVEVMKIGAILLINQVLISFILYLRSNLSGLHLFRTDSVVSVLDRAIMIIICGWLLWGRNSETPFRIEWFVWAQTAAYLITIWFVLFYLRRRVSLQKPTWNPVFALMILKKSYPFAILILLMTFYNRIDSVMLERMLPNGALQAGIYAQSYRLLEAANMIAFLFAGLLLPMFAHMLRQKSDVIPLVKLAFSLLVIPAFLFALAAWLFRNEIMDLLYREHVFESSQIFAILMCSFIAICTTYIYGTLLTANGNLKSLNIMATGGMILNIVLNLVLIPRWEATGAAVASLVTQSATAIVQVFLCYRILRLKADLTLGLRYLLFACSGTAMALAINLASADWYFRLAGILFSGFLIALIFKIIDLRVLRNILKAEQP
jgi:O-antigen/teichoic acid export membrane protein